MRMSWRTFSSCCLAPWVALRWESSVRLLPLSTGTSSTLSLTIYILAIFWFPFPEILIDFSIFLPTSIFVCHLEPP
jgi:hypothetical protein